VGAVGIEVEQPARGDEMFGDHDRVLFVEGTQLSEDLFVELAAGDAFGDLGFLDARAAGALLACVVAGVGLARRTAVVVIAAVSSATASRRSSSVDAALALIATATIIIVDGCPGSHRDGHRRDDYPDSHHGDRHRPTVAYPPRRSSSLRRFPW
jgi:hypothetical protein